MNNAPRIAPYEQAKKRLPGEEQLSFGIDEDEDMPDDVSVFPDAAEDAE